MESFQGDIERLEKLDAQVLGVSPDSLETHREFVTKLGLDFPLVSDDGTIRGLYGSGRLTYLIDRSGTVRYVHTGMPDIDRLVRELEKLNASP